jgi:small subunit ribosomal protein S16
MLAIRLQRLGRTGYPTYRVAVQESHRHPSSGRVVAYVGSYNPHTKEANFDTEKVEFYLNHGAQPTTRVAKLLKDAKVKLPDWVVFKTAKTSVTRNAEKLRKNQPAEEVVEAPAEEVTEAPAE